METEAPRLADLTKHELARHIESYSPAERARTPTLGYFTLEEAATLLKLRRTTIRSYVERLNLERITYVGIGSKHFPGRRMTTVLPADSVITLARRYRPALAEGLARMLNRIDGAILIEKNSQPGKNHGMPEPGH